MILHHVSPSRGSTGNRSPKSIMVASLFRLAAMIAGLSVAGACHAQPGSLNHGEAPAAGQPIDMQGGPRAFIDNPNGRAFYALTVATLKPGAPPVDVEAYEAKSFVIFRAMGASMGMAPEAMQDHLKAIPRQMIRIVKEDPTVLDSFDNFADALVGPK